MVSQECDRSNLHYLLNEQSKNQFALSDGLRCFLKSLVQLEMREELAGVVCSKAWNY